MWGRLDTKGGERKVEEQGLLASGASGTRGNTEAQHLPRSRPLTWPGNIATSVMHEGALLQVWANIWNATEAHVCAIMHSYRVST